MAAYFARRLLLMIPTFLGVTFIAFWITRMVPGGPVERQIMAWKQARAGGEAGAGGGAASNVTDPTADIPKEALEELKKQFNFHVPWYQAYFLWLWDVLRLDLGKSFFYKKPVWDMIAARFPVSLTFGLTGFLMAYLVSIPLGIAKALRHGSAFDVGTSAMVFIGYSIPGWAFGGLLLLFLATGQYADVFPLGSARSTSYSELPDVVKRSVDEDDVSTDFGVFRWERLPYVAKLTDYAWHMALPVFCYMMGSFATLTILTKNSLMDNLGQDYVRTAFAKGLHPRRVIFLHTLRNSLIPLATGLGHALGVIMAGSYLIEYVFNIDGVGYFGFTSLEGRDYNVVMGVLVINSALIMFGNVFSDVLYALVDPRIRFE
jgi:microcin C transport system permease protein